MISSEMRKVKVADITFQQEFYPRDKPSTKTIEQYVDALRAGNIFPPIELDQNGFVLLDGYHRWKAHQEAGLEEIEAHIVSLNGFPRLLYAAGRNSDHGDRLSNAEKKNVARAMAESEAVNQTDIQKHLRVSAGTVSNWVSDITQKKQRKRDGRIWWLHQLGWTTREIGEVVGVHHDTVNESCRNSSKLNFSDMSSRGHTPEQIAQAEDISPELVEILLLDGKSDADRLAYLKVGIQPYDVWNFSGCDPRFGAEYPGRIPGQVLLHILYFFTQQGNLIIDPMAGSGTTIDACAYMARKVYGYDAHPAEGREDILLHDLALGWPARTAQANLIFWDPPYFNKKDAEYGDKSISRLDRAEYLNFFNERFKEAFSLIKPGTIFALIMSDWNDEKNPEANIGIWDYANAMQKAGWTLLRRIDCPLPTQQVHPDIVNRFRQDLRLARLSRSVLIGVKS